MPSEELTPEQLSALLSGSLPEIKGYRVLRRIGRGGMSYVYLCVQESLDRLVAIKIIQPDALVDETSKQRFESEARTIAKLEHPSIVSIHEVGRTPQGLIYYVMPYLPKGHLGQHDFTRDEPRVAEILRSLLSALGYLHERGIVHRDVKADNVLFDGADRPLLTDFGIALSKADTSRITTAGLALGSGGYMAPEQARGEAVDGRADLYSVGVLAYELLTGRLPFMGNDALSQALMHASDPIPRMPPNLKHWQPFIDKAMAKSPAKRYQNTVDMQRALDRIAGREQYTSRETRAISAVDIREHTGGKRKLVLATLGVALLAIAGVAAWKFWPSPTPVAKPAVATANDPAKPGSTVAAAAATATETAAADEKTAASEPAPAEAAPVEVAPADAASTENAPALPAVSAVGDFGKVKAALVVTPLSYDPIVPGARELTAARRQLAAKRISAPAGDNLLESLLAAQKLVPDNPELASLAEQAITAVTITLADAIKARRDKVAITSFQNAEKLAKATGKLESAPWKSLQASLPALLLARLEADAQRPAADAAASKALAQSLKLPQSQLEPAWSLAGNKAAPVQQAPSGAGPATVMAGAIGGESFAVMREEVTRGDYAQFVAATNRAATACRNRNAPIAFRKRSWSDPGFAQGDNHPVVCVSHADAVAYAEWLGSRTGNRYRLPRRSEWVLIAGYSGNADACLNGHIDCASRGTIPARQGPTSPLGIYGAQGNVREWLNDCDGGCGRRMAAGLGWRDGARNADPIRASGLDANTGFDDVGIRLVRVVGK